MLGDKISLGAFALAGIVFVGGCATPLTTQQENEYKSFQAKGFAVEEKNPDIASALGILPGGGSFYVREYGLGVVNLLFWPLSILWDPVSGYEGATAINYHATKATVDQKIKSEMDGLDNQLVMKAISTEEYVMKKKEIEQRYGGG